MRPRTQFCAVAALLALSVVGQRARLSASGAHVGETDLGMVSALHPERAVLTSLADRLAGAESDGGKVTVIWCEQSGPFLLRQAAVYSPADGTLTVTMDGQKAVYCPMTPDSIRRVLADPRRSSFLAACSLSRRAAGT